jgi:Uma2 family endonuclease
MDMATRTLLSDEEFLALPDTPGKQELLDGELIELPPAKYFHSELAQRLMWLLITVVDKSRIWIEVAYWMRKGRWLIPDLSVRWPDQGKKDGWFKGSPMIAIEIASRGNTAEELELKTALYLEQGAAEVWIVYPKTRTMVISRQDGIERVGPGESYYCDRLGLTITSDFWTPVE